LTPQISLINNSAAMMPDVMPKMAASPSPCA
jgi:hypothetical protein